MRKITSMFVLIVVLLLSGCQSQNGEKIQEKVKDVEIIDVSNGYMYDQTLLIPIRNGYRYTEVTQDFDENTQKYTITITIGKPIKDN